MNEESCASPSVRRARLYRIQGGVGARVRAMGTAFARSSDMTSEQAQVVVGYDFSESALFALERAVALAVRAPFHVLHFACIVDPHAGVPALPTKHVDLAYADRVREEVAAAVDRELRSADTAQPLHYHVHVHIARNAAKELLDIAHDVGADLVIVGCNGAHRLSHLVLGSVAERVTREAGCAVVIARPKDYPYVAHEDVVEVESHAHRTTRHYSYDARIDRGEPLRWPM